MLRSKKRDISGLMSGHGHHDANAPHGASHEEEHETSSDDFPADEPRSPGWLPLLGGALVLAGIFTFVALGLGNSSAEELAQEAAANPSAAAPATAAPMVAPAQRPLPRPTPAPAIATGAGLPANHPQFQRPAGN